MRLKKEMGQYVETREEMEEEMVDYFEKVMREDKKDRSEHIEKITRIIPNMVS